MIVGVSRRDPVRAQHPRRTMTAASTSCCGTSPPGVVLELPIISPTLGGAHVWAVHRRHPGNSRPCAATAIPASTATPASRPPATKQRAAHARHAFPSHTQPSPRSAPSACVTSCSAPTLVGRDHTRVAPPSRSRPTASAGTPRRPPSRCCTRCRPGPRRTSRRFPAVTSSRCAEDRIYRNSEPLERRDSDALVFCHAAFLANSEPGVRRHHVRRARARHVEQGRLGNGTRIDMHAATLPRSPPRSGASPHPPTTEQAGGAGSRWLAAAGPHGAEHADHDTERGAAHPRSCC